jgi:putative protease
MHSQSLLLGIGFDGSDGHIRITKGENFRLFGGSKETHGVMQEKAIKFNEHLRKRGKQLSEINQEEFREIAHRIGLKRGGRINGPNKKVRKKRVFKKKTSKKAIKKVQTKTKNKKAPPKKIKKSPAKNQKNIIGKVTHYFGRVNAAVVKLKRNLAVGDTIHVKGHTTDFTQAITSMQLDHRLISVGKKGQEIGLEVNDRVRAGDQVFPDKGTTS